MTKHVIGALIAAVALSAGAARAGDASADEMAMKKAKVPSFQFSHEEMITATVEAIDLKAGTATLKGPEGNSLVVKARDPKNLKKAKVGDQVVAKYRETLSGHVKQPGEQAPKEQVTESATNQPQGAPGAAGSRTIVATVTITAINTNAGTATFKGPEGNSVTVKARDPKNLKKVKVGDELVVKYSEAIAVSLKPAK